MNFSRETTNLSPDVSDPKGKLAVLGGPPAFADKVHVGRPNIGDRARLIERINKTLDTRWLSNGGPFVQEFERRIADTVGVKHCIAMCNATVALEIAIRALELTGEVIVPSFTFIATAHALQWQEITPVFCDIDQATHNINPQKIKPLITPRTTGILAVHLWGRPCEIDELKALADEYNLKLLFDAAHGFGCSYHGRNIGGFGHAEVFSFHATKFVNSGEGGAVVTNDDALAARMRLMKNFGFSDYDKVIYIGTNGKMNEICAAMGLTNLESLEEFVRTNRANFETYQDNLRGIPGLSLQKYHEEDTPNYQYVVVEVNAREFGLTRNQLLAVLHAENVLARRYFYPGVHRMEPYRSHFPHANLLLADTERVVDRILHLPTGTGVTSTDIRNICGIIRTALQQTSKIREALSHDAALAAQVIKHTQSRGSLTFSASTTAHPRRGIAGDDLAVLG
jgi:dTDP-4-amino-4,6-dideoxygalactose transaminase